MKKYFLLTLCTLQMAQPWAEEAVELEKMAVTGLTPLGLEKALLDSLPSNVQTGIAKDLERTQSYSISDYLNTQVGGIIINDAQNNPFQPDVQYRGFTASPLLGMPQGLSVYFNGVRYNEPFGDTVNWDLIPEGAIDRIELHPGSDPVYGLNTLGGAIMMRSKTGFSFPEHKLEVSGGSWGRHSESLSSGWNNGTIGYFLHLRNFKEDGWRDYSPTHVKQAFGVLSWRNDDGELNLTLSGQDNDLTGNGTLPIQLYKEDRNSIFTYPDQTGNRLFFVNLDGKTLLTSDVELSGNAYYRYNRISTFNGDDTDYEECSPPKEAYMCDEEGEMIEDVHGNPIPAGDDVDSATNNFSKSRQKGHGVSLQSAFLHELMDMENRFVIGFSYDKARINYKFDTELARLTDKRGTVGSGYLAYEPRVRLDSDVTHYGLYFVEQLVPFDALTLTLSGRFNSSRLVLNDKFGNELNGDHRFNRFNPSIGFSYQARSKLNMYGRYSESSRAPTAVELTCADPEAPCKLPNAFLADPPLKQVVAKTFEAGLRGGIVDVMNEKMQWHIGAYHTLNIDDILFISAGNLTGEGYFDNVGKTRRYGIEASISGFLDSLKLAGSLPVSLRYSANYTYLNATFQTPFVAASPNNPSAVDGTIVVNKGDRIPGLPEHVLKFDLEGEIGSKIMLGFTGLYSSSRYYRGDEANQNDIIPGYWVFNLRSRYKINEHLEATLRIDNLFDKKYQTFGLYGDAEDVLGEKYDDPRFIGPGSPRGIWGGLKLRF